MENEDGLQCSQHKIGRSKIGTSSREKQEGRRRRKKPFRREEKIVHAWQVAAAVVAEAR